MQLKKFVPVGLFYSILLLLITPAFAIAQESDADLADPVDTADILVAKGGAYIPVTDKDLQERLGQINSCLEVRVTGVVKGYVRTYVQVKPEKAKIMLGKRLTYFPLFEEKLKEYGLPSDLKYLAVVESALNAKAVSRVGATGLWQFMSYTGSDYGLKATGAYDDRSNPVKSTDAAMRYLKHLYEQYDDWALALAAYNSGPTRVNSAIKRAHSRNFWNIQRYLPKETRNYVPAFIAATYICNYFQLHNIDPYDPIFDEQLTAYELVHEGISFRDIADATGVEYSVIKNLNPGFKRDYVPPSTDGHFVVVPERVMPAFIRYLNSLGGHSYTLSKEYYVEPQNVGDGKYWSRTIQVTEPDHVDNLASRLGANGDHLKSWNELSSNYVYAGDKIKVWYPVLSQKHENMRVDAPGASKSKKSEVAANNKKRNSDPVAQPSQTQRPQSDDPPSYLWHTVRRNETLDDIARQYDVPADVIKKMNNNLEKIVVGSRLKVKEL